MRNRKQNGQIVRIGSRWYVRYWEKRNIGGTIERKRVSHELGPVTTRAKKPSADIKVEAERHMATVNSGVVAAERIVTIGDFVERVYLPWIKLYKRASTEKGYRDIWEDHLKPLSAQVWLKDARTYHVQGWLNQIGSAKLGRNTLKHIKSVVSAIFTLAKQQDYFQGENPSRDADIPPSTTEPQETRAYSPEEIQAILALLPEPAATAFAVAAYTGLRHGEIQGLRWDDYFNGELKVSRSIWNGRETPPKTRKSSGSVPVIPYLKARLEMHRLRCGNPQSGPIFTNAAGKPLALNSVTNRLILPTLNRCEHCGKTALDHPMFTHKYKRDDRLPEWYGWHAARRGLGSNLYRLKVPEKVIQAILRHANVSTTANYYIKTVEADVKAAMEALGKSVEEANQTQSDTNGTVEPFPSGGSVAIQ